MDARGRRLAKADWMLPFSTRLARRPKVVEVEPETGTGLMRTCLAAQAWTSFSWMLVFGIDVIARRDRSRLVGFPESVPQVLPRVMQDRISKRAVRRRWGSWLAAAATSESYNHYAGCQVSIRGDVGRQSTLEAEQRQTERLVDRRDCSQRATRVDSSR